MRWRLLLEEFTAAVKHIAGEKNLLADALSWLEMRHKSYDDIDWEPPTNILSYSANNDTRNREIEMWMNSLDY